jgi:hypothetical protein
MTSTCFSVACPDLKTDYRQDKLIHIESVDLYGFSALISFIHLPLATRKGMLRTYSYLDPHGSQEQMYGIGTSP